MSKKFENKPVKNEIPEELRELEQDLTSINPKIFYGLSNEQKLEILEGISFTIVQEEMHYGPLPDSETLVEYDKVIPNGADRIMQMAEKQQNHRMSIENRVVKNQTNQSLIGQIFGLILA